MRTCLIAMATVAVMLCALDDAAAQATSSPRSDGALEQESGKSPEESPGLAPALVGKWKSAPDRTELTSDLQKSVWGEDAVSIRDVALEIERSGEATLMVTTKVVDAKGKTFPASTSVEEMHLTVGGSHETVAGVRREHDVEVLSAERRYPDDPDYKWKLEGVEVTLATITGEEDSVEVRVDEPRGKGSFWASLGRVGKNSSR